MKKWMAKSKTIFKCHCLGQSRPTKHLAKGGKRRGMLIGEAWEIFNK